MNLEKKNFLITGGTGSFGNAVLKKLLKTNIGEIRIFSRDEKKQHDMRTALNDERVEFVIGDVRNFDSVIDSMTDIDFIFFAAALKQVPSCEFHPMEAIKTNVLGAENVIRAAIQKKIKKCIFLSTDKAVYPINAMGLSKAMMEKVMIAASRNCDPSETILCATRYGNVMGSRGSVIPFFLNKRKEGQLPITDLRMTRFMISLEQGVNLVWHAFENMLGGEIYVKKIPSIKVTDIAKVIAPEAKIKVIGIRPGEKLHEQMINYEDAPHTYEYEDYFKILPAINSLSKDKKRIGKGVKVVEGFTYTSDNNDEWMDNKTLLNWLESNINKIGAI